MKKHCSPLFLFVLAIAAACAAQSGDGSLGDLARKARTKQKAVMVFNDDNMQRSAATDDDTGSASAASGAGQDAKGSQPGTSSADAKDKKKDQAKSSGSKSDDNVSRLRKQLDSLKQEQSVWSKSAKDYEEKLANEADDFRRRMDQEALDNDKNNVQVYQRKIDQTQSELEKAQQEQSATKPESSTQPPANP